MRLKVIIVDDEPPARRKIRQFLEEFNAQVVGEFADRDGAVQGIRTLGPDLLFLDVQLRSATGFDVLADVRPAAMPATVFVTAYDEYAVRAFEVHAVDYLLKPFDRVRFRTTMQRVLTRLARPDVPDALIALLDEVRARVAGAAPALKWILTKRSDHTSVLIPTAEIHWIEAAGNYVYIHTATGRILHRQPLGALGEQLDATHFARVHRSAIVNLGFIQEISPWVGGDYHIKMRSGTELRLSRHYREAFHRALGRGL